MILLHGHSPSHSPPCKALQIPGWFLPIRIGHDGTLKIQKMISEEDSSNPEEITEPPTVQTGSSAASSNVLDIDSSSLMFVGGIPIEYDVSSFEKQYR